MLDTIISDKNLAWQAGDLALADFLTDLPPGVQSEIQKHRSSLRVATEQLSTSSHDLSRFPEAASLMQKVRASFLDQGPGLCLIRSDTLKGLDPEERKNAYWMLMCCLGAPLAQNESGQVYVPVVDEGQRMTAGGRYHKSNEGGELHTDSPQYDEPPRYVSLLCVHPAWEGGRSKLLSAYAVHNALLAEAPDQLPLLYESFHFHRKPTTDTTFAPIFTWDGVRLTCRYLGDYVRSGHEVKAEPLSAARKQALSTLDGLLDQHSRFVTEFDFEEGDIVVFENRRLFHGRSGFRDDPAGRQPRRELGRVWITPTSP